MSIAYFSPSVASKTALIRFTECIATETKPFGVAAFAIGPGTVRTAMANYSLNSVEGRKWLPWFHRIFEERLDAPPERPADLVLSLASGKADALSGLFLQITDNLDEMLTRRRNSPRPPLLAPLSAPRFRASESRAGRHHRGSRASTRVEGADYLRALPTCSSQKNNYVFSTQRV